MWMFPESWLKMYKKGLICSFVMHYIIPTTGHKAVLVGNHPALGSDDPKRAPLAEEVRRGIQIVKVELPHGIKISFKWAIVNESRLVQRWDDGDNKQLLLPSSGESVDINAQWGAPPTIIKVTGGQGGKEHALWEIGQDLRTLLLKNLIIILAGVIALVVAAAAVAYLGT